MRINNLELVHFRNYDHFSIEFDQGINILIGDNAQGKTNLIEAIYLLSICKSFRTHIHDQLIQFNQEFSKVKGDIYSNQKIHHLEVVLNKGTKKAKLNGKDILKISDYVGYLNAVVFVPEDLSLIKGSPSQRRKFIDLEISKISPIYVFYLAKFNKLLKERNQYLKMIAPKNGSYDEYLETIDEQLVAAQIKIIEKRKAFIQKLTAQVQEIYEKIAKNKEEVVLEYAGNMKVNNMLNMYKKNFSKDLKYQTTSSGIHKDDVRILINNKPAGQFASQGQQRTIILCIKIALLQIIKDEIGEYPILLLDDVLSELDDYRKTKLLDVLSCEIQTFITTTSIDGIEHQIIKNAKKIYVTSKEEA